MRDYSLPRADSLEVITSPTNDRVKAIRALDRKKTRAETGLFLAEGPRLVQQGLDRDWTLDTLAVSTEAAARGYVAELVDRAAQSGARIFAATDRVMAKMARKDNPGAVLGVFRQSSPELDDLSREANTAWIALYEVRDPGNLGTILRTADCVGAPGVILVGTCCDPFSIEAVRASMGSIFDVPVALADFDGFNAWRTGRGLSMVAASMNGTVRHDCADLTSPAVILMGNEQAGLPADVEAACDTLARIPMRGGADSLNLAQATAILAFEAWRQRGYVGAV